MADDRVGWLAELDARERVLVHMFRCAAVALGRDCDQHRAAADRGLEQLTRETDRPGTQRRFWSMMQTLGGQAWRQVRFHTPECPCLGEDEATFLRLCALLRAHHRREACLVATRLLPRDRVDDFIRPLAVVASRATLSPAELPERAAAHEASSTGALRPGPASGGRRRRAVHARPLAPVHPEAPRAGGHNLH